MTTRRKCCREGGPVQPDTVGWTQCCFSGVVKDFGTIYPCYWHNQVLHDAITKHETKSDAFRLAWIDAVHVLGFTVTEWDYHNTKPQAWVKNG